MRFSVNGSPHENGSPREVQIDVRSVTYRRLVS
jgi:hypothetical protein